MDEQQRQPRDSDRNPVRDQIKRAVASGRISSADGEIRLTNVSSAQSMTELGLITRDLDQVEAVIAPRAAVPSAAPTSYLPPTAYAPPANPAVAGARRTAPILIAVLAIAVVTVGGFALFAVGSSTTSFSTGSDGEETVEVSPAPGEPGAYGLTVAGIRSFLEVYRDRFSTSKVVDLVMYDEYAVVQVPVAGKDRHASWIYRDGEFTDFGGVTANFPGSEVIDTRKVAVPALVRNIAKARKSLRVEDYDQTYVSFSYRPMFDEVPHANIYVSNPYHESGYLSTRLDGDVERSYPFGG